MQLECLMLATSMCLVNERLLYDRELGRRGGGEETETGGREEQPK